MKRPSFQFYPADWRSNAKLRRCSEAARGCWIDILCILHDSDEYGIIRWPLSELCRAAGVPLRYAGELVEKKVLKGGDSAVEAFTHTASHAGMVGETHILIEACAGPVWYSSRLVVDEWQRMRRGKNTRFDSANQPPSRSPIPPIGGHSGDGPSSLSSSSSSSPTPLKNLKGKPLESEKHGGDTAGDARKPKNLPKRFEKKHAELTDRIQNSIGNDAWRHDRVKWMNRIKAHFEKSTRVVAEVENAAKEGRIKTTAAQYAEQIWKEFS